MMMRPRVPNGRQSGIALLTALFVALVLIASSVSIYTLARSANGLSRNRQSRAVADSLAEAATVTAADAIYDSLRLQAPVPAAGAVTLNGESGDYTIAAAGAPTRNVDDSGLNTIDTVYRITGTATIGGVTATTRRIVVGRVVPLFQFALFTEEDMIFFHPAPMKISGPVHTNGNLYLFHLNGLTFDTNHVRVAGKLYGRAPHDSWYSGYQAWYHANARATDIRRWVADPFDGGEPVAWGLLETRDQMAMLGMVTTGGYDSEFGGLDINADGDYDDLGDWLPFGPGALARFSEESGYAGGTGNTLLTGEHTDLTVEAPMFQDFSMFVDAAGGDWAWDGMAGEYVEVPAGTGTHTKGPYHAAADLSIITMPGGGWRAYTSSGVDVTSDLTDVVTPTTMYDARQAAGSGQSLEVAQIDMKKLNTCGRFPSNGLLYLGAYGSGTGTDAKGFQLVEGFRLAADLNVVSPDSLYVVGDYNTASVKSAAVMADSVNMLSNDWDNTKGPGTLPLAADTTYNVAVVTGDTLPESGQRSNSAFNLLRLHEDWHNSGTKKVLTLKGSVVSLGYSEKAKGIWQLGGDYYLAPRRNWIYDTRFNSPAGLPPFTPSYVRVEDVAVW